MRIPVRVPELCRAVDKYLKCMRYKAPSKSNTCWCTVLHWQHTRFGWSALYVMVHGMNNGAFLVIFNLSCVPADGLIHVWFAAYEVGKLRNVVFRLHIVDSIGLRIVYVGTGLFHTHFVAITTIAICSRSTHWNLPRSIFFRMT